MIGRGLEGSCGVGGQQFIAAGWAGPGSAGPLPSSSFLQVPAWATPWALQGHTWKGAAGCRGRELGAE